MPSAPVITYNSKTITFPTTDRIKWRAVDPSPPSVVNVSRSGAVETIVEPRVDVRFHLEIEHISSMALLVQIDNWVQWGRKGGLWTIAMDGSRTVSTTLSALEAAGSTSIQVASATGITIGRQYVMRSGPNYQLVHVSNVVSTDVTINSALDGPHAAGSIFRDPYYVSGYFPKGVAHPVQFVRDNPGDPPKTFNFILDFCERAA